MLITKAAVKSINYAIKYETSSKVIIYQYRSSGMRKCIYKTNCVTSTYNIFRVSEDKRQKTNEKSIGNHGGMGVGGWSDEETLEIQSPGYTNH